MNDSGTERSINPMEYSSHPAEDQSITVPLYQRGMNVSEPRHKHSSTCTLIQLPSEKLQFTIWHELRDAEVKGDQLRAPRVREGPVTKEQSFYTLTDEEGKLLHHDKVGKERDHHRNEKENWEVARHVNVSYQHLSQSFQKKNFERILRRLHSAEEIILIDNGLQDLSSFTFPSCIMINLSKNYVNSFKQLPRMPHIRHLILSDNQISGLSGIERFPQLDTLEMCGNGIIYEVGYRNRVFQALPNLKILDGTIRTAEDMKPHKLIIQTRQSFCSIS